ncbi:Ig-like domain-containing protein [Pantoea sp. 1.19]|uniref:Ig-like domain-containing protein n=1 Tax=Pantoea sp. 1.19 TaxID=1925589 RepID=UPI000948CF11|nr:Ig-like domain-containing protein [Pantoea sp. 1.19]
MLSADKTTATADGTDAVTLALKYTRDGAGVAGANVLWTTTGGILGTNSSRTGSSGGTTVKITSATAGTFTVTASVDGVSQTSQTITYTAPTGD